MSIFDDVQAPEVAVNGEKIPQYLELMSKKDADATRAGLANPAIPHTVVADILTRYGFTVSETSVRRYRNKLGIS